MDGLAARISPVLHLARITSAFAVVGNLWFVLLWSRGVAEEAAAAPSSILEAPLWRLLTGGALAGVGLYTFATSLNDTLDLRRDRSLHPHRPLASGRLGVDAAGRVIALSLIVAVLGCSLIGGHAVRACLAVAAAVLVYNSTAKHVASVGLVVLSLLYAGHMLVPNPWLRFLWPVWFAMTHMLLVGAVAHRVGDRRPRLNAASACVAAAGWAFWTGVLAWLVHERTGSWWPSWAPVRSAVVTGLLAAAFLGFVWVRGRRSSSPERAAGRIHRYGSFWLVLYASAWLLSQGLTGEGMIMASLALAGLLGMTLLRELYQLIEHPVGYRR